MDYVAVWCGYTPSTIGDCFASPMNQYFARSFKESIVDCAQARSPAFLVFT
jgi:hypothetical protein